MTNAKVDIFNFDPMPAGICRKGGVPLGSFWIEPKCFFPALPSLAAAWEECDAATPLPTPVPEVRAQVKLKVFKGIDQPGCPSNLIYTPPRSNDEAELVVKDIISVIDRKATPFWSMYEDPARLLQSLQEDEDVWGRDQEGLLQIGGKGGHIRLFYLGFTALWLEEYKLAIDSLTACKTKPQWRPSGIKGDLDPRPIVACIDRGLVRAREGLLAQNR
jgi:hypothetical protein